MSPYLTKTGKNLSTSSLLPFVANPYQRINNSSYFRLLVICYATAPVSICVVFVRPHRYLFTILESGNISLNSLATWSAVIKGMLRLVRKPEKNSSTFTTFWFKFAVAEIAPKSVNYFCRCTAYTYLLCFTVFLCLLISLSPPCAHIVLKAKPSSLQDFCMNLNSLHHESLNSIQYLFFFDVAGTKLFANFFAMFWFF